MKMKINRPLMVFAAGLLIVAGSSVGATRAALTYSAEGEEVNYSTSTMAVKLLQNGDYMSERFQLPEEFKIGQKFDEDLTVKNTSEGNYDEYIRVTVKKSWMKKPGILPEEPTVKVIRRGDSTLLKDTELNPNNIELGIEPGWIIDDVTEEQVVYYYTKPVPKDEAVKLINSIKINNAVWDDITVWQDDNYLWNDYHYDDKYVSIEVQADAVQTHNAEEAMLGAWGVKAEVENNVLKSVNDSTTTTK